MGNVALDALICPLQIINDIEPLSLTLHGLNAHFIHHPSNVKISRSAISWKLIDQTKKKLSSGEYIFTPLCLFWG